MQFKRENPFDSGHALAKFEKRVAPQEYKEHALKSTADLPNEAQMMAINRQQTEIDKVKQQLFV